MTGFYITGESASPDFSTIKNYISTRLGIALGGIDVCLYVDFSGISAEELENSLSTLYPAVKFDFSENESASDEKIEISFPVANDFTKRMSVSLRVLTGEDVRLDFFYRAAFHADISRDEAKKVLFDGISSNRELKSILGRTYSEDLLELTLPEDLLNLSDAQLAEFYHKSGLKMSFKALLALKEDMKAVGLVPTITVLRVIDAMLLLFDTKWDTELTDINIDTDLPHIEEMQEIFQHRYDEIEVATLNKIAMLAFDRAFEHGEIPFYENRFSQRVAPINVNSAVGLEGWVMGIHTESTSGSDASAISDTFARCLHKAASVASVPLSASYVSYGGGRRDTESKSVHEQSSIEKICSQCNQNDLNFPPVEEIIANHFRKEKHSHISVVTATKNKIFTKAREPGLRIALITAREDEPLLYEVNKISSLLRDKNFIASILYLCPVLSGGILEACSFINSNFELEADKLFDVRKGASLSSVLFDELPYAYLITFEEHQMTAIEEITKFFDVAFIPCGRTRHDRFVIVKNGENIIFNIPAYIIRSARCYTETRAMLYEKPETFMSLEDKEVQRAYKRNVKEGILASIKRKNFGISVADDYYTSPHKAASIPGCEATGLSGSGTNAVYLNGGATYIATAHGSCPNLVKHSPFVSSLYSQVIAVNKLVASGCEMANINLSASFVVNELYDNHIQWGNAVSIVLGGVYAQIKSGIVAMATNFSEGINQSAVFFAAGTVPSDIFSAGHLQKGQKLFRLRLRRDDYFVPDFKYLKKLNSALLMNLARKNVTAAFVAESDIMNTVVSQVLKSGLGISFSKIDGGMFTPCYGDFVIAVNDISEFNQFDVEYLGVTDESGAVKGKDIEIGKEEFFAALGITLPVKSSEDALAALPADGEDIDRYRCNIKTAVPSVIIPDCTGKHPYRLVRMFDLAGGKSEIVGKNRDMSIDAYAEELCKKISGGNILALPDSADFELLAALLCREDVKQSISKLLDQNDGLILGLGSGFNALARSKILSDIELLRTDSFVNRRVKITVNSVLSPWLSFAKPNESYQLIVSSAEGRAKILTNKQDAVTKSRIATVFDTDPFGSDFSLESFSSADGRILGHLGSNARIFGNADGKNNFDMSLFRAGIDFFK